MFVCGTFLFKIDSKGFMTMTDIFCGIVKGIPKVSGVSFFHAVTAVIQLYGLINRRRHYSVSQYFVGRIKVAEITKLSDDYCSYVLVTDIRSGDRRLDFLLRAPLDGCFDFIDLSR